MTRRQIVARAHALVQKATAAGVLPIPTRCMECGRDEDRRGGTRWNGYQEIPAIVNHHPSYSPGDELHVIPLCWSCHGLVHADARRNPLADPGLMLFACPTASWFEVDPECFPAPTSPAEPEVSA